MFQFLVHLESTTKVDSQSVANSQRQGSTTTLVSVASAKVPTKPEAFGSVGHLNAVDTDDDDDGDIDIDKTFEEAKLVSQSKLDSSQFITK